VSRPAPTAGSSPPRARRRLKPWLVAAVGALSVWAGLDLFAPRSTDVRVFDPAVVARLDTGMWRSYYDRKPVRLFVQLAELMRSQFNLPWLRSHLVAGQAARAAFAFKSGRNRAEYQRAMPGLVGYYRALRRVSTRPFDVDSAARLELEWWIVHREHAGRGGESLERALAEAAAVFYRAPADLMGDYSRERTAAMDIRDVKAGSGGVSEEDWRAIEDHLRRSWRALAVAVRQAPFR
jgi:hypothetical protein